MGRPVTRPTVFGLPSPWSGDEHDPIPWTYWVWHRAYVTSWRVRHVFGIHDWRPWPAGSSRERCDWCGTYRTAPR